MIDIHSAETASAGHQVSLWYTDKYSTEDWYEALEWLTDYYKDDDTLIAIDLKNEPHGKADVPSQMANGTIPRILTTGNMLPSALRKSTGN